MDRVIPEEEIKETKGRILDWIEKTDIVDVQHALNMGWHRVEELSRL